MEQFFENFFSQIKQLPKEYVLPLVVCLVGLILIVYGLIQYFGNSQPQQSGLDLGKLLSPNP